MTVPDDRLRLIFTCCHPALAPEARVALTLRTLGGLSTPEIARLPRRRDRDAAAARPRQAQDRRGEDPLRGAPASTCPSGCRPCWLALYLVFNEGYLATSDARSCGASFAPRPSAWRALLPA